MSDAGQDPFDDVLRARARALAHAREEQTEETVALLPFVVGGEQYAVEVTAVHQVLDAAGLHPLLGAPRGVIGALLSRTRAVPVLDLRLLLGLEGAGFSDLRRVVVLEDGADLYGVAVERLERRVEVPRAALRAAGKAPFRFIGPERLPVLDPSRVGLLEAR